MVTRQAADRVKAFGVAFRKPSAGQRCKAPKRGRNFDCTRRRGPLRARL